MDEDCLFCVFELLNANDIQTISLVCKQFNMIANDELVWKSAFTRKFPYEIHIQANYKLNYMDHNVLNNFLLQKVDKDIHSMRHDQHFSITHVFFPSIPTIPTQIRLLTQLQTLDLQHVQLESLPKEIGLLTRLQSLQLYGNRLKSVPTEIGLLIQLETLYLNHNQLKSIPTEIGLLTNLQALSLHNNQLKSIPQEIGQLTQLHQLYLNYILIDYVPSNIKHAIVLK